MRREREAGSSKLQTEDRRDRDFSWIGCVIFDGADEGIGMGHEEESHSPKSRRTDGTGW